jgi:hypothetical protein
MSAALLLLLALQNPGPVNAQCPVRPTQKAKAGNIVVYKGRIIGLC